MMFSVIQEALPSLFYCVTVLVSEPLLEGNMEQTPLIGKCVYISLDCPADIIESHLLHNWHVYSYLSFYGTLSGD